MGNGESIRTARARKEMFSTIIFSVVYATLAVVFLALLVTTGEMFFLPLAVGFCAASFCGMMSYRGSRRRYFESFNVREISPV